MQKKVKGLSFLFSDFVFLAGSVVSVTVSVLNAVCVTCMSSLEGICMNSFSGIYRIVSNGLWYLNESGEGRSVFIKVSHLPECRLKG